MSTMDRRAALKLIGVTPLIGALEWLPDEVDRAADHVRALRRDSVAPEFFTDHEWRTVQVLVDLIIPRDERSGSATDAKVPEFMDFMMIDGSEGRRSAMRRGLGWLDDETRRRFTTAFIDSSDEQRRRILDDIAWPERAPQEVAAGVAFFNSFRDLTGAGFFSSRMGYEDLQYIGNVARREWPGCPEPALRKLGVDYSVMEHRS